MSSTRSDRQTSEGFDRYPAWAVLVASLSLAILVLTATLVLHVDEGAALLVLLVLPIALLALRFGIRGGLAGALTAMLVLGLPPALGAPGHGLLGYVTRSLTFLVLGALIGLLSDEARRLRVTLERRVANAEVLGAATAGVLTDVSAARHQTQRDLQQERDFLAAVLESLDEGVVACDAQGNLSFFNDATRRLHGLPARSIPAAQWADHYDLYLPDGTTPMPAEEIPLMRAFAGETIRDVPMVIARAGTEPRTLMATGRPLVTGEGRSAGAVVAMRDVTDELRLRRQLELTAAEAMSRLARAVEYRDTDTGAHVERMSHRCRLLAERVGLAPERCAMIEIASRLHDIGKVAVPDAVLLKPGKLNAAEWAVMESHTVTGHELLTGSGNDVLDLAAIIALNHHERVDGTGYPHGLRGTSIPLEARIAAIADAFDALTSDRPYRPAFTTADALGIMARERGTHFDADLLDLFVDDEATRQAAGTPTNPLSRSPDLPDPLLGPREDAIVQGERLNGRGAEVRQAARERRWAADARVRAATTRRASES